MKSISVPVWVWYHFALSIEFQAGGYIEFMRVQPWGEVVKTQHNFTFPTNLDALGSSAQLIIGGVNFRLSFLLKMLGSSPANFTYPTGHSQLYTGHFDEFRIWRRYRTENETSVSSMASILGNTAGLLLYYRFDNTQSFNVPDSTNNK